MKLPISIYDNLPNFHVIFEDTSQFSSLFASLFFLAQMLYNLVKISPLKCKCLRFFSAQVKFRQIPLINFELKSQFLFKFSIIFHRHDT